MKSFSTALLAALCALTAQDAVNAFQPATPRVHTCTHAGTSVTAPTSPLFSVATNGVATTDEDKSQQIRREGGPLAFKTKYGALNPYAIYYGSLSILLGIPWFFALKFYGLLARVTQKRFDRLAFIPTLLNHLWGVTLLRMTRSYPVVENMDILRDFYKENRTAMFVANHNSWMDIPFMGATIGWRNYKFVAKKELEKVPILSAAIVTADNLMVDRKDKRSGLRTLRAGMEFLKKGIHLCTFPEGTRSRDGRLNDFLGGAFKMAHKVGAPIIPLSIVGAQHVQPIHWMFPLRPSRRRIKVVVHPPVESKGLTEAELAKKVRQAMVDGLPDDQKPLED